MLQGLPQIGSGRFGIAQLPIRHGPAVQCLDVDGINLERLGGNIARHLVLVLLVADHGEVGLQREEEGLHLLVARVVLVEGLEQRRPLPVRADGGGVIAVLEGGVALLLLGHRLDDGDGGIGGRSVLIVIVGIVGEAILNIITRILKVWHIVCGLRADVV